MVGERMCLEPDKVELQTKTTITRVPVTDDSDRLDIGKLHVMGNSCVSLLWEVL